jgi:hypothetical protein
MWYRNHTASRIPAFVGVIRPRRGPRAPKRRSRTLFFQPPLGAYTPHAEPQIVPPSGCRSRPSHHAAGARTIIGSAVRGKRFDVGQNARTISARSLPQTAISLLPGRDQSQPGRHVCAKGYGRCEPLRIATPSRRRLSWVGSGCSMRIRSSWSCWYDARLF